MAGITLATAEAQLQVWLEADAAVAKGQSYSIAGRSLARTDATAITEKIDYWQSQVSRLSARASGRSRVRYIVGE